MSEAADASEADFTPEAAAETIEKARSYEEPLRRRTEGITWMIWGLVGAGIQLTFSAGHSLFRPYRPETVHTGTAPWFEPVVIGGWLLVGMTLTLAAWRVASLNTPRLSPKPKRAVLGGALFVALLYGSWGLMQWLAGGMPQALFPTLAIGAAWLGVGALDLFETTPTGRRTLLAIGGIVLAAGVLAALVLPWSGLGPDAGRLSFDVTAPITILVGGGVPFLAGLWQSWTG